MGELVWGQRKSHSSEERGLKRDGGSRSRGEGLETGLDGLHTGEGGRVEQGVRKTSLICHHRCHQKDSDAT